MKNLIITRSLIVLMVVPPIFVFGNNEDKKKPNIIFILTDDLGYGDLGVLFQIPRKGAGKPAHATPHLDEFSPAGPNPHPALLSPKSTQRFLMRYNR